MKNVLKSSEPQEFKEYKYRYRTQFRRWKKAKKVVKDLIQSTLISDQKGLCAYCEMSIHENFFSVEHFIPCEQSTPEINHDLDWQNMLAICMPPGGITKDELQELPHNSPCCGKAKNNLIPSDRLLNPLNLTTSRIFRFKSEDGEILLDEIACQQVEIPVEYAEFTIEMLRLNVQRLKNQRVTVIDEINKELDDRDDGIINPILLEQQIASEYFDSNKNYPRFFTTIRWILREGAEKHLFDISYSG